MRPAKVQTDPQEPRGCNGELIRHFRHQAGLSQQELAERCDCSERLIRKAEQGGNCSANSLTVIAKNLSTKDLKLVAEDLKSFPIAMAKRYNDALYSHQAEIVDAIEDMLDDEVHFRVNGDPMEIPFAGDYRGVEELREGFRRFFSVLEVPDDVDHQSTHNFYSHGLEVYMWGDSWIHPRGMPLQEPMKLSHYFRFQAGKLVWFEDQFDIRHASHLFEGFRVLSAQVDRVR
ncbi:helix-turn-helix domain-containing protein [Stieleria sp. JC731]|uniref:helix-turn-helix domain-containing protein n=1 Tax=Pirellulaceae TaxID=2691357 RepID=UPI001E4E1E27|nr:helix-turn-helix domain-containing protein [Stieleria sp. JC731]MCC9600964.1 helix-turn-helix domain-containing protein [Stieleria sp. JC731]